MALYDSGKAQVGITPFVTFKDKHGGLKFMVKGDNNCGEAMIKNGIYEYPLIQWSVENFVKSNKGKDVLDIGAHIGTWSAYMAPHCRNVYSFEPQKMTYHALNGTIALNGFNNIIPYNVALGTNKMEGKTGKLHIISPDGGGSSLMDDVLKNAHFDYGDEIVTIRSLDSYNFDNIGFIKIDVEGWELEVLKGGVETLKRCGWPKIIFEANSDSWYQSKKRDLFIFVESLGYRIINISIKNMFLAEPNPQFKQTDSGIGISNNSSSSSSSSSNSSLNDTNKSKDINYVI